MNSLESLTVFFGWCTVFHIGFLALTGLAVMGMRSTMIRLHGRIFGVGEAELPRIYFQYLAHYQTIALAFGLIPYVALKMMV
jgi:hypothetical protein